ncbi:mitogen-activated protein kinase-binding protein 1 isoform X1 [Senna tora]|uniref:Mitogen-activated protein kinase-binding protein 1 isoform X1 n=1 Tax=Senna tora TaxID=362788 RepID=A0A835CMB5_9FABA|nr:mitogen-activated protein kinase-binding protein 1 isoform X1 [Senna tora]
MKPSHKIKRADNSSKLVLEEIIGLTTKDSNGLASNVSTSTFAYLAGSVVIVYNLNLGTQSHLMVSHRPPKRLSCVALSQDGRFVAAGEAGRHSSVLVWDSASLSFISELKGHLFGVACISFSPNGKHLVSVGGYMYLWDWRSGELVTKLQATSSCSTISSVSFSSNAKFIVTAGKKHLKFWVLGSSRRTQLNGGLGRTACQLHGKPANLAIQRGNSFISITSSLLSNISNNNSKQASDSFPIYALTEAGILHLIDSGMAVKKSVDLKVKKAFALSTSGKLVACACNNGIVQFFSPESLEYAGSILYSQAKKFHEDKSIVSYAEVPEQDFQPLVALPDAVACQFSALEKLVVIYEDHSLYIWNIQDVNQATRCCVIISHSSCIWDIKNLCCENMHDPSLACVARGCSGGISFATCSADGTIRLWDLALQSDLPRDAMEHHSMKAELMSSSCLVTAGTFERDAVEADVGRQEFRSLAISSDGKYLAAGDCKGNLHIFNLQTSDYTCFQNAHGAEILTLSFTLGQDICEEFAKNSYYLASGGKDCIINLYDVKRNFDLINSIDDHSAAVTCIKFTSNNSKILSCSADSSLVLRDITIVDSGQKISQHHCLKASNGTVYDMAVDPTVEIALTVGQDKKINTFDITAGKLIRSYKQDKDFGHPIKVTMDPSGTYAVCSFSNKSICIYDFVTGEMVANAMGHAEVVTGVIFLPDCKHMVSVDGDGCVFVWKLPASLSSKILERIMEKCNTLSTRSFAQPSTFCHLPSYEEEFQQYKINSEDVWLLGNNSQSREGMLYPGSSHGEAIAFKFSVSRLPKWAQAKVTSSNIVCRNINNTLSEAYSLSSEVITPAEHASSPESTKTHCLSSPGGNFSNFALDNRWLSVYTVCMDALSSPEMQNLMDVKIPDFSSSLSEMIYEYLGLKKLTIAQKDLNLPAILLLIHGGQDKAEICKDQSSFGKSSRGKHGKLDHFSEQLPGCNNNDVSWCEHPEQVSGSTTERLQIDESGSDSKGTTESNLENVHSEENSDLFKQHFGSLSNTHKMKTRESFMRRYSARYIVQQDYPGDCKRLFSTPVRNITNKSSNHDVDSATHTKSEDTSLQVQEIEEVENFEQDLKNLAQSSANSVCESTRCPVKENSVDNDPREDSDQMESLHKGSELEETIIACKEALSRLDSAAESAVQLFSRLEINNSGEEIAGGTGAQLFNRATELLPTIIEKVNAVSRLVRHKKNNLCYLGLD